MRKTWPLFGILSLLFTALMSLPWLVPHCGALALVGLLPLLVMERLATQRGTRHFWWWHYAAFVLWNAVTTWWVGMATVGGAVFAILANALQMSLVFGSFRWVKRRTGGVLPYIYLAAAWLAWERYYFTIAQISWPWLALGNAFADSTALVQWYSVLGTLGGSLWVWCANLALFGLMLALSDGRMARWNAKARVAAFGGALLAFFGPMVWSLCLHTDPDEGQELPVVIGQPNIDPYHKFQSLTQDEQDERLLDLLESAPLPSEPFLVLAPETFTSSFVLDEYPLNRSFRHFQEWLSAHPQASFLFGASAYQRFVGYSSPDPCAYDRGDIGDGRHLWVLSRNSAMVTDTSGRCEVFHKSKLVVGTESTPYPGFFIPLERLFWDFPVMGKCVGQEEISCLHVNGNIPVGVAVCYESVYGEYCTGYVRKGARLLSVITNDSWWGNTPGYRQHLNYSRLRAIETRRWVARCGNSGISAFIDPAGHIVQSSEWWVPALLQGTVRLRSQETFFVRYGDIVGRVAVLLWLLLAAAALSQRRRV